MTAKTAFARLISKYSLKKLAGDKYFERGVDYLENGAVVYLRLGEYGISARVQGTESCPYAVRFWMEKQELQWGCACPLGTEGAFCKHLVATGLAWLSGDTIDDDPIAPNELQALRATLEAIDVHALADLVSQRAIWDDGLLAELALAARVSRHKKVPANRTRIKNRRPPK